MFISFLDWGVKYADYSIFHDELIEDSDGTISQVEFKRDMRGDGNLWR